MKRKPIRRPVPEIEAGPATTTVPQASVDLGISVSYGYELAKLDAFPAKVITVGKRRLVLTSSLLELLSGGGDDVAA